ncbi:sigma-54-dependent Fis family transcriptional regulator [Sorangium sp. So ce542]|uniref:sigma-54-dependent Fis family transcriptional regulator n=1 Tax=Sorangium sp. So ce542 TaxID=3133316 RepID=UPI003F63AC4C
MDLYPALLKIVRILLSEDDDVRTPELLLGLVIEATGADRGFIVVREGGSYEQRFAVCFDRATITDEERRFSRGLVRQAIETRQIVRLSREADAPRFALIESLEASGASSVLVVPLAHGGEVYGTVYVEHGTRGAGDEALRFVAEFADLAGLFLKRAIEREALRRRTQSLERDLFARHDFQGIVAQDPRMIALLKTIAQVADADATVLIRGETGTGKELVARALHVNSRRRAKPCVTLHTSALPGTVLESELFGHVRGAFTGADRDRVGRIASAQGGTLFLDEVAEIAPDVQAKLLRFLQFGEIQRVGSDRTERVDVRVIAATHQDLPALVEAGKFRRDLYFRLKVIELEIPPLRARAGDIPLLVDHFLRASWKRPGEQPRWTSRAERALREHAYPGNVRELAHAVERACILATGPVLDVDLLPPDLTASAAAGPAAAGPAAAGAAPAPRFSELSADELEAAREAGAAGAERAFLAALMDRHGGNVSQAARASGLNRTYLQKLLARHRADGGG